MIISIGSLPPSMRDDEEIWMGLWMHRVRIRASKVMEAVRAQCWGADDQADVRLMRQAGTPESDIERFILSVMRQNARRD